MDETPDKSNECVETDLERPFQYSNGELFSLTAAIVFLLALAAHAPLLLTAAFFILISISLFLWLRSSWLILPLIVVFWLVLLSTFVMGVREAARRNTCSSNIRQLALAISNYESANRKFPPQNFFSGRRLGNVTVNNVPGATTGGMSREASFGLMISLHPQFEEGDMYMGPDLDSNPFGGSNPYDVSTPMNSEYNAVFACTSHFGSVLHCPSFSGKRETISQDYGIYTTNNWKTPRKPLLTQYVGMGATTYENLYRLEGKSPDGMIVSNIILTKEDVTDGLSNTIILCETREEKYAVWMDGTTASVFGITSDGKTTINKGGAAPYIPAANFGGSEDWQWGPSSMHEGMAHHAFGDDSVRAIADDIAPDVYKALITRSGNDGEATESFFGE